ncbi:MAG: hypothetical protein J1E33_06275 [Alistipes sp.]|nr:hypothetical protein [Alistipes sp.]
MGTLIIVVYAMTLIMLLLMIARLGIDFYESIKLRKLRLKIDERIKNLEQQESNEKKE